MGNTNTVTIKKSKDKYIFVCFFNAERQTYNEETNRLYQEIK